MKKIGAGLLAGLLMLLARPVGATTDTPVYLPILMYHQILEDGTRQGRYVISPEEFEDDLKILQKHGYTPIKVKDLIDFVRDKKELPEKPVMITFDDGFESDYTYAFPLLKKYNMKAVFSVIGKYADLYTGEVKKDIRYSHVSWPQIKEMHDSGLAEFHNHSYDLHNTDKRRGALKRPNETPSHYEQAIAYDFKLLNDKYTDHVGTVPTAFTCPYGYYNESLKQAVKQFGYAAILTSGERINLLTGNPEELYALGRYVRPHGMKLEKLIKIWEDGSRSVQAGPRS